MRLRSDFHPLRTFRKRAPIAQMDASILRCWSSGRRPLPLARNDGERMPLVAGPLVLPRPHSRHESAMHHMKEMIASHPSVEGTRMRAKLHVMR